MDKLPELIAVEDDNGGIILAELKITEGIPEYIGSLDNGKIIYFYKYKEYHHSTISLVAAVLK